MKQVKYIFILLLTLISVRASAVQISAGGSHTMILMDDGTLWACGSNANGQLGVKDITYTAEPIKVMDGVAFVSAGYRHTMIIMTDGSLWACGYNSYGQLGDGTTATTKTPVKVMESVAQVSAGEDYTMIVKKNGALLTCGYNYYGQLGNGTKDNVTTPTQIMTGVSQVSAGDSHSLILKTNGTVWACGYNYSGQLGDGTNGSGADKLTPVQVTDNVASVSAGGNHSLFLKTDGTLWSCGNNSNCQLGDKTTTNTPTLIQVKEGVAQISAGNNFSLVLYTDGKLEAFGSNGYDQLSSFYVGYDFYYTYIETANVVQMDAGSNFTVYAKSDGTFWACGKNDAGQLGDGTITRKNTPVMISNDVSIAAAVQDRTFFQKKDGTLWATGINYYYALGDGSEESKSSPVQIATADEIVQIASGDYHTLYLTKDGTLWGFRYNYYHQLGLEEYQFYDKPVKVMTNVAQVAAALNYSLVVKKDGSLWGVGTNWAGQLGDGTTTNITSISKIMDDVAQVAAGYYHSVILKKDGSVWAAGQNWEGMLGNGTFENSYVYVKVMDDAVDIAAGGYTTMVIKKDGSLWGWGGNWYGQLGTGDFNDSSTPVKVTDKVASVSVAYPFVMFVKTDGSLWAAGYNYYGQFGNGDFTTSSTPVKVMDGVAMASTSYSHSAILKTNGTLYTCGSNECGQLGDGTRKYVSTQMKMGSATPSNPDVIEFSSNGVTYLLNKDKTATISLITADRVDLDIPSTIAYDGVSYSVTAIGDSIFHNNINNYYIYSVTFPKTITTVSEKAFDWFEATCIFWNSNTPLPSKAFDNERYKNGNFMLYVNKAGIAPSSVENVIINGVAESITLKEGYVFNCRRDFKAKKISITHEYIMDTGINGECMGYETIALPFDVQTITHETQGELTPFANFVKDGGKKPFWLYELSSNGWVKASGIKANTPYLISMPNNEKYTPSYNLKGKVTFSSENVTVYQTETENFVTPQYNGATFYPCFSYYTKTNYIYVINSNTQFFTYEGTEKPGSVFVSDYRYAYPFEARFYKNSSSSAPFRIGDIPFVDGETTGIEQVLYGNSIVGSQSDVVRVYTLSGQLISTVKAKDAAKLNLPSGVYVINGKKIIVK